MAIPRPLMTGVLIALATGACGASTAPSRPPSSGNVVEPGADAGPGDQHRCAGDVDAGELDCPDASDPEAAAPEKPPRRVKRAKPPAPPASVKLPETVVDRVFFAENQASLDGVVDSLDAFARLALDNRDLTLVLIARADTSELEPDRLSSRRALAVRSYLVRSGVPEGRIRTHAMGVRQPRAASSPGETGAANRCVELATD